MNEPKVKEQSSANEIADGLLKAMGALMAHIATYKDGHKFQLEKENIFTQSATMLRQQQEKIKNLEQWEKRQLDLIEHQQAENDKWKEINDRQTRSIKNKQAEIEALKTENKFFKDLMGDVEILVKGKEK